MDKTAIDELRGRYRPRGVFRSREFLLPPDDAVALARDLAAMGAVIRGCDLWVYVNRGKGWIAELPGAGYWVDEPPGTLTPERGAAIAEDYIRTQLPEDVDFVAFLLENGDLGDWFA